MSEYNSQIKVQTWTFKHRLPFHCQPLFASDLGKAFEE